MPPFETLPPGANVVIEIATRNFLRRDQSKSQLAMVAALIRLDAPGDWLAVGDGRNDVPSGTAGLSGLDLPAGDRPGARPTQKEMCRLSGVSEAYLRDAETLVKVAPDLIDAIVQGSVSVRDAYAIHKERPDARAHAVEAVRGGRAKTAKAALEAERATAGGESPDTASPAAPTPPAPGGPGTAPPGGAAARGRRAGGAPPSRSTPAAQTADRDAGADSAPASPAAGHDEQQVVDPAAAVALAPIMSGLRAALGKIDVAFCSECPRQAGLRVAAWRPANARALFPHWFGCVLAAPPDGLLDASLRKVEEEIRAGHLRRAALLARLDPEQPFFDRALDADHLRCVVLERAADRSRRSAAYLFGAEQDATRDVEKYARHIVSAFGDWGHVVFLPRSTV